MIGHWIRAEHITDESLQRQRSTFEAAADRAIVFDNFLQTDKAEALAALFDERALFEELFSILENGRHKDVERDDFLSTPIEQRLWSHWRLDRRRGEGHFSAPYLHYLKLQQLATEPAWLSLLEAATGQRPCRLVGMEANNYVASHHQLGAHDDFGNRRVLCCVFYLSRDWRPEYGMRFRQYHEGRVVRTAAPLWNRLLVFQPQEGYVHDIEPRTEAGQGWARPGVVWWYEGETA